jgi:hypothetical protein
MKNTLIENPRHESYWDKRQPMGMNLIAKNQKWCKQKSGYLQIPMIATLHQSEPKTNMQVFIWGTEKRNVRTTMHQLIKNQAL